MRFRPFYILCASLIIYLLVLQATDAFARDIYTSTPYHPHKSTHDMTQTTRQPLPEANGLTVGPSMRWWTFDGLTDYGVNVQEQSYRRRWLSLIRHSGGTLCASSYRKLSRGILGVLPRAASCCLHSAVSTLQG